MLEISLLTPFSLQLDGKPLTLISRRTEALFVYLLCTGKSQAREVLANLFWDDLPQTQASGNLRVLIANLHKAVGPYITIRRQSIAFDRKSSYHCDFIELEQELAKAHSEDSGVGGLSKVGADRLTRALSGYQGELLPGFYLRGGQGFDEWLATEREWLWTRAIAGLSDLSNTYLRLGEFRAGIEQAQRLVKFDPLREESHQQLMKLLAADGQTQAALAHYQRCIQILDKELGVAPSSVTTRLFEQIQQGEWQKSAPSIDAQPTLLTTPAHNLPRQMTPFIGREPELERLRHYLLDPAYPLVTLVAEGGAGKSRLALASARQLLTHEPSAFVDGIWFISLAGVQVGDNGARALIATMIGNAMGLHFQGQRSVVEQLLTLLQPRKCLLLLDNFEQLIDADAPDSGQTNAIDFIVELLEQLPHLQLLVTSRIPLDLNSEFVVRLMGLPVPTDELPTHVATFASVRLFAERATRTAQHFDLTQHLSEVAAICRTVAGLPLAIELAAAWSGSLTPIEILLALQANLDFLTTHRRDVPLRQRSMRAVFDTSWQLLSATAQQVLAQTAWFNGGFTLDAAEVVVAVTRSNSEIHDALAKLLDSLVHQSLLQYDERGRYRFHTLLREYAGEKLADLDPKSGDKVGVAHRHSRYYLALVDQANTKAWYTRAEMAPIYADLDNVRKAWQWASWHVDLMGLRLGWLGLWQFFNSSALFQEGEETFRTTLEVLQTPASASAEQSLLIAQLQVAHASFLNALGRYDEAVTLAQGATTFAETIQDDALKARGYAAWGTGLYRQGQTRTALTYLEYGVRAAQTAHLTVLEANLHKRLANTHQASHDFTAAHMHYAQALTLYRQQQHLPGEGEVLNGLGWCSQQQHDLQQALIYLHQAAQIHQAIENPHGQSMTLINLAVVYEMLGDYRRGYAYRQQVLELLKLFDDPYQRVLINHGLGVLFSRLGDYVAAEPYYLRALELDRAMGDRGGVAWTQNNLGLLYNQRGDYAAARVLHQEALQTSMELGAVTTQGLAWSRLGQDYYGLGEFEESYEAYLEALAIQQKLGQQVWAIESKSGLTATQLALNMQDEALALVEEILFFLAVHSLDSAREPLLVYWNCYQVLVECRDQRARALLETAYHLLQEGAAKTPNQATRHSFLHNHPIHRAIILAFEKSQ